jgi:hypothetical protein
MLRCRSMLYAALLCVWFSGSGSYAADGPEFDGRWSVVLTCPKASDGALPFTWEFEAEVKASVLHGEHGTPGQPAWMTLDGKIAQDGSADLTAKGLTGRPDYNLNHTDQAVAWQHPVNAQFAASHGDGHWVAPRTCQFKFSRVKT